MATPTIPTMETARHQINNLSKRNQGSWLKLVTAVDRQRANGFAFQGDFFPFNKQVDLPVGGVVVFCLKEKRSKTYKWAVVQADKWEWSDGYGTAKFLDFRDAVADALGDTATDSNAPITVKTLATILNMAIQEVGITANAVQVAELAIKIHPKLGV